jgi:hypothetical protein
MKDQAADAYERLARLVQLQADFLQRIAQLRRESDEHLARTQEMLRALSHPHQGPAKRR